MTDDLAIDPGHLIWAPRKDVGILPDDRQDSFPQVSIQSGADLYSPVMAGIEQGDFFNRFIWFRLLALVIILPLGDGIDPGGAYVLLLNGPHITMSSRLRITPYYAHPAWGLELHKVRH